MQNKTLFITQFSALLAIEFFFCFTPLGSLPAFGPIVATLAMIPVIITGILFGTKIGSIMGMITGLFSFIVWTFMPPVPITAFLFTPFYSFGEIHGNFGSLLICFVPRILTGTFASITYKTLNKTTHKKDYMKLIISSIVGSLTNTFGVMSGIWLFFGSQYSATAGKSMLFIFCITVLTNGIPEAIVSAVIVPAICKTLKPRKKTV